MLVASGASHIPTPSHHFSLRITRHLLTLRAEMSDKARPKSFEHGGTRSMRSTHVASSSNAPVAPALPPLPSPQDSLQARCEYVLQTLELMKLSFGELVTAVCYGEATLRSVQLAQLARASLYNPERLLPFLETCYLPPRAPSGTGPRPAGGSKVV